MVFLQALISVMFLIILLPLTFSAFSWWHFNFIENKLKLVSYYTVPNAQWVKLWAENKAITKE